MGCGAGRSREAAVAALERERQAGREREAAARDAGRRDAERVDAEQHRAEVFAATQLAEARARERELLLALAESKIAAANDRAAAATATAAAVEQAASAARVKAPLLLVRASRDLARPRGARPAAGHSASPARGDMAQPPPAHHAPLALAPDSGSGLGMQHQRPIRIITHGNTKIPDPHGPLEVRGDARVIKSNQMLQRVVPAPDLKLERALIERRGFDPLQRGAGCASGRPSFTTVSWATRRLGGKCARRSIAPPWTGSMLRRRACSARRA